MSKRAGLRPSVNRACKGESDENSLWKIVSLDRCDHFCVDTTLTIVIVT